MQTKPQMPTRFNEPEQIEAAELKPIVPEEGKIRLLVGDVPKAFVDAAREHRCVAWDIETSGLDWRSERIGLCQVWIKERRLAIVKINKNKKPRNLIALLEDSSIQKIFHHAMFDLRFMSYHWGANPANIACTKVASKLLDTSRTQGHTLAALLQQHLGVTIDKSKRKSDWLSWALSQDQLAYAGDDVIHLPELLGALMLDLQEKQLFDLANSCFAHIPTQVQLDIRGYKDVYGY
jgi:ribonuclease D